MPHPHALENCAFHPTVIQSCPTDVEFAKGMLFGERVAHGLLGLSIASGLASRLGFIEGTAQAFRELE